MIVVRSSIGSSSRSFSDQDSVLCRSQCRFNGWLRASTIWNSHCSLAMWGGTARRVMDGRGATCGASLGRTCLLLGIAMAVGTSGGFRCSTAGIVGKCRNATSGMIFIIGIVMPVWIGGKRFNACGSYTVSLCSGSAHTAIFSKYVPHPLGYS